jgi:hypothetical protein
MKKLKCLLSIPLMLLFMGCPDKEGDADSTIIFINNSDKTILEYSKSFIYPDTSIITTTSPFDERVKQFAIKPHSTYKKQDNWKSYLSKSKSGVMTIFLFDKAIVDTVPWKTIREDYLVAKRYEYTLKQLDSLNWTITYP